MNKISAVKRTMSTPSIAIVLDNQSKVYFSGEIITGVVKFQTEPHHKILVLSIILNAEYFYTMNERETAELIYTETCPIDIQSAGEGNSEMPFSLTVRPNSPTSLSSSLGGIRYRLVSFLVFKNEDKVENADATEMVSVNLQKQLPEKRVGLKTSRNEGWNVVSCCCGSLSVDFQVVCASLLCGHNAVINARIVNNTGNRILGTSVSLVQKIVRQSDKGVVKSTVISKERGTISPGKRQVWLSERFLVPPLPPTSADSYFEVCYKLVMAVHKTTAKDMRLKIPLFVSNLPREQDSSTADTLGLAEGRCTDVFGDVAGFKPLYVTYIT